MLNENLPDFPVQFGLINLHMRAFVSLSLTNSTYFDAFIAFLNVAFHVLALILSPADKKVVEIFAIEKIF